MRKFLLFLLVILLAPIVWFFVTKPTFEQITPPPEGLSIQSFKEITTPFTHEWTQKGHPFTGAAVLDVDGNGTLELFVGGGRGQEDMLLSLKDGALSDITKGSGLSVAKHATHGMASSDMDADGDIDLVVARENGVSLYINEGGKFTRQDVPLTLQKDAVPLSVAVSDVNGDGLPDIYVSAFVSFSAFKSATFNDPAHAKKNVMLINQGGLKFADKSAETGTAGINNSFHSTFADLDRNGTLELILSQNTGEVEIYTPQQGGKYKPVPTNTGYGFWMGLGVGDYDRDGDEDIFVSNVGTSIPASLTTGDIKPEQRHNTNWALLQTKKGLTFKHVSTATGIDKFGFAWGAQFADLNLDGELDLIVAQNYIKWFVHGFVPLQGKALVQAKSEKGRAFYHADGLGLNNPHYGQSPVIVDLNADGRPDVVWLNMAGPLRAHLNQSSNAFITFDVPDHVSTQGAIVSIGLEDGSIRSQQVIPSTGLMTDPTPHVHFGLGRAKGVKWAQIITPSGAAARLYFPKINQVHKLTP